MWNPDDLKPASFRGVPFDYIDTEDGFKKVVAKYDHPYSDGSDLEDMGLDSRTVRLKAVFLPESYAFLEAFIATLKEQGPGEVVHPVFGKFDAVPETVSIKHDERAYFAEVDITFIEHLELALSVPVMSASSKAADAAAEAGATLDAADTNLNAALKENGVPTDVPTDGLGTDGYMATLAGYTTIVRDAVRKIDAAVSTVKGYVNQATAPFKLITSTVAFATGLPGSVLGSFAEAIESVAGTYTSLVNAPGKFTDSLNFGLLKIEAALGDFEGDKSTEAAWHISKASALCSAVSLELAIDEATEAGASVSLKVYGIDDDASRSQLMTLNEIDAVAVIAREAINAALIVSREAFTDSYELTASLKRQALIIQETADSVRLKRETIIAYDVPCDMPLHLLAFKLYGDIEQADRLLRINSIPNPNFLKAGTTLRVYA